MSPRFPEGFQHEVVALNWGGKRDWATWCSAEASAMLGIQLLPMGPVSQYLAGDPQRIRANVAEAAPDGFQTLFGDYLAMYLACPTRRQRWWRADHCQPRRWTTA